MIVTTKLSAQDILPLTCSRTGTCCHGKQVLLNPWELHCLAREKKMTPRQFRDLYCEFGGIRLKFDGKPGWKEQAACSQYVDTLGCSVHLGRPLSCRLYPLGRQIQSEEVHYMYQGTEFPCLDGCPVVTELPQLSVGEYLEGQQTGEFEKAQDAYLEIMQNLADMSFELLLDTGLTPAQGKEVMALWHTMGHELPDVLAARIGNEWMETLMLPKMEEGEDPLSFAHKHNEWLQLKAQEKFGASLTAQEWQKASVLLMALALHLARGLGAHPPELAELWIETAKSHMA